MSLSDELQVTRRNGAGCQYPDESRQPDTLQRSAEKTVLSLSFLTELDYEINMIKM